MSFVSLALAIFICATVTLVAGEPGLRVGPNFEVVLSDLEEGPIKYNDIVSGARSCGGNGKILAMRYEPCKSGPGPCKVPSDNVMRRAELHFAPSQDITPLGIRVVFSTKGIPPTVVYDKVFENNEVYRGNQYLMSTEIGASKMFQGQMLTIQFELYGQKDGLVEICSVADFEVV